MRTWLRRGCFAIGTTLLACWLAVTLDSRAFQAALARRLDSIGRPSRPGGSLDIARATRREAQASGLIGRIEIPRLGMSALIVEGAAGLPLRRGVGHVQGTAFPGERGNVGLAGHRDTYFRRLEQLSKGDRISIRTPDGTFAYEAESVLIVRPDRGDLLSGAHHPSLTLVTCYPFYWVGPAPKRFVVLARPVAARTLGTSVLSQVSDSVVLTRQ